MGDNAMARWGQCQIQPLLVQCPPHLNSTVLGGPQKNGGKGQHNQLVDREPPSTENLEGCSLPCYGAGVTLGKVGDLNSTPGKSLQDFGVP